MSSPLLVRRLLATAKTPQAGFTLMEVMIVILLSSVLMLAASGVFLTMLTSRARSASDQILKSEGNYALQRMEFLIRNGVELMPNSEAVACRQSPAMTDLVIRSVDGGITQFFRQADASDNNLPKIASNSGTFLTSGAVTVSEGPTFTCIDNNASGNRFVMVNFSLTKNNRQQDFSASISMRNY